MSPSFNEGDFIISIAKRFVTLKLGDNIVFNHPKFGFLIKTICEKTEKGFFVEGKSPLSTDSKSLGLITNDMIEGKVIFKI